MGLVKQNNFVDDGDNNCLNYPDGCWTCVYHSLYGQHHCKRPNRKTTYTTVYNGGYMKW